MSSKLNSILKNENNEILEELDESIIKNNVQHLNSENILNVVEFFIFNNFTLVEKSMPQLLKEVYLEN